MQVGWLRTLVSIQIRKPEVQQTQWPNR
jgi:hypothetical protein